MPIRKEFWHADIARPKYELHTDMRGKEHRLDGPAILSWHENGQLASEEWYKDGDPHRVDGPALQHWYPSGQLRSQSRLVDGYYQECVPFNMIWWENGRQKAIYYAINKRWHNWGRPAVTTWYENGQMEKEEWYSMGKLDRYDGPARSEWAEDGTVIRAEYFIKDRPVGPKEALIARDKIRDAIRKLPIPIRDEIWQYYCTV